MNIIVSYRKPLAAGIIIAAVLTTAAYAADEQTMTQPTVTSRTIAVEHIRIASGRPFAEVRQRLESAVPELDPSIAEALARGDQERAQAYHDNGPKLSIFLARDHGALLQIAGAKKNAVQYEIGNPLDRLENDAVSAPGRALRAAAGRVVRRRAGPRNIRIRQAVVFLRPIRRRARHRRRPLSGRHARSRPAPCRRVRLSKPHQPRHCEEHLRRGNPARFATSWIASRSLSSGRPLRVGPVWLAMTKPGR